MFRTRRFVGALLPVALGMSTLTYCEHTFDTKGLNAVTAVTPNSVGASTNNSLFLQGVGMRRKALLGFLEVDVYLTGFSLSNTAAQRARVWQKTEREGGVVTLADAINGFNDGKANGTAKSLISLKFVRNVTTSQIVEAFNDSFKDLDPAEVAKFKAALTKSVGEHGMKNGEVVGFFWMNGGGLCISVNDSIREIIFSSTLEKRLLEVYVDPTRRVSPLLLQSIYDNLAASANE